MATLSDSARYTQLVLQCPSLSWDFILMVVYLRRYNGGLEDRASIPRKGNGFFRFYTASRSTLRSTQSIHWVQGALFPGVTRAHFEADDSPSSARLSCTSISPYMVTAFRSNTGVVVSNPTRCMGVDACVYSVCVVLCVGRPLSLARGWRSSQSPTEGLSIFSDVIISKFISSAMLYRVDHR
jgi:hypothetical protein